MSERGTDQLRIVVSRQHNDVAAPSLALCNVELHVVVSLEHPKIRAVPPRREFILVNNAFLRNGNAMDCIGSASRKNVHARQQNHHHRERPLPRQDAVHGALKDEDAAYQIPSRAPYMCWISGGFPAKNFP